MIRRQTGARIRIAVFRGQRGEREVVVYQGERVVRFD